MVTYIVGITAKPGSEDEVIRLHREAEERMRSAAGFVGVTVYRAQSADHDNGGTHFITIEQWESLDARQTDRQTEGYQANHKALIAHLLPAHSHDYYDVVVGSPVAAAV